MGARSRLAAAWLALLAGGTLACGGRPPAPGREAAPGAGAPVVYPEAPYGIASGATLPDLAFGGVTEDGQRGAIHLHDFLDPGGPAGLLVVRVNGGRWCGTSRWHAAHTDELLAAGAGRLRVLDLVETDEDNHPASEGEGEAWRGLLPAGARAAVGVDAGMALGPLLDRDAGVILPLYVFVDRRTMRVRGQVANPDPDALAWRVASELAALDGVAAPAEPETGLVDGLFHRNEWDMLGEVTLPGAPAADPTSEVADSAAAVALGQALFGDAGLSPGGQVSCATCHDPKQQLSDARPQALGEHPGDRRTPTIALASLSRWQFWDGRADTLWAQALGPLEDANEMGGSRLHVVHRLAADHASGYAAAFPGAPLPEVAGLPAHGKPGDGSFEALSEAQRSAVTRAFVNAGKALAAYERTFRVQPNRLDAYLGGQLDALSGLEKIGLSAFTQLGCMQCHWGPRLTDDAFHVTRVPTGRVDGAPDRGRLDGVGRLRASEFGATSVWSDDRSARPGSDLTDAPSLLGAFRTRPLRGVATAAPYGHGGAFGVLSSVTETYGQRGLPAADPRAVGEVEPWLVRFSETAQWSLVPFLASLTADPILP